MGVSVGDTESHTFQVRISLKTTDSVRQEYSDACFVRMAKNKYGHSILIRHVFRITFRPLIFLIMNGHCRMFSLLLLYS